MKPDAKKVFIAADGNSFFNQSDAINHKNAAKIDFVTISKDEVTEETTHNEEDEAIEIIEKMKGTDEKEIVAALKKAKISTDIINQLMHK